MTEFQSRWLSPQRVEPQRHRIDRTDHIGADPAKSSIQRTDRTDRIDIVGSVSASNTSFGHFTPLDDTIIASEAGRRSLHEIETRLTRLTARAADPGATPLARQLAADWTAIRDAKRHGGATP